MSFDIKPIGNDTEMDRMLNKYFLSPICTGFVEIGNDKFVLTKTFTEEVAREIKELEVSDNDIFLAAHPKTGSTWLHEMVWLITNNFDYKKLETTPEAIRLPFLEYKGIIPKEILEEKLPGLFNDANIKELEEARTQKKRTFKTHLHWSLLPEQIQNGSKKPKIIISLRNPYDVCVSFYHHSRLRHRYTGSFEEYCQLFMAGRVYHGPYWKQVFSYWNQRNRSNLLFVRYSEMKNNFPDVVRKVASFLEKNVTDEQVDFLTNYLNFENMKNNAGINRDASLAYVYEKLDVVVEKTPFIRQGKEGAYKDVMSLEIIEKFDKWFEENISGTSLTF